MARLRFRSIFDPLVVQCECHMPGRFAFHCIPPLLPLQVILQILGSDPKAGQMSAGYMCVCGTACNLG